MICAHARRRAQLSTERRRELIALQPPGRMGRAQDIANAVSFFASPRTEFVTGQVLSFLSSFCSLHWCRPLMGNRWTPRRRGPRPTTCVTWRTA
ncbi:SDR family oxidoreductase [Rhodoligotrophos defluvii]|uniref:SDR family oxidoreductase n=1 Tax=Rhodoligotrophos defluvii TaxID=2561934 RepID=UPI0010C9867B|nr:SDR family oxidoreductase [Rhodoligotrophos defluvii]